MNWELIKARIKGKEMVFLFSIFLLWLNVLFLNFKVLTKEKREEMASTTAETSPVISPLPFTSEENQEACPEACWQALATTAGQINQASSSSAPPLISLTVKEVYIPLGTGSTKSQDWEAINGAEAVIDLANYPQIKSIIFEASIRIPTANGRVYAKLYNVTEQHDVWYSEVSSEGPVSQREESKEISLGSGRKLYRVMMKSTMSYEAILDSARIKIILK
ncbi:MAG: hypothetical protein MUP45_00545 [Candidatus Marinimicrobia bacterium]|nr:hypothetical protein [Candidatus Neomarinimicrobiota bacterium]